MTQSYSRSSQLNSTVSSIIREEDQAFCDVIAAISEGKYSWACVLMLRSAGYNPLHYMPYRTYNRIIKANLKLGRKQDKKATAKPSTPAVASADRNLAYNSRTRHPQPSNTAQSSSHVATHSRSTASSSDCKISDLPHLDAASEASRNAVTGGWSHAASDFSNWWSSLMGRL